MNAAASSSPRPHGHDFRGDIAGLRAVAVAAVVLFHAGVLGIPGGFVGVDVFFVISGFLITRILVAEIESTGRINVSRFWMRRARRLMPAAALVALVTFALSALFASPLAWGYIAKTGAAAMAYLANVVFAFEGSDYFAEDLQQLSPFLHTWSLGVEEQFYIVLPLVLLVVAAAARRLSRAQRRTSLITAIIVGSVLSLIASIVLTPLSQPHAFYLMPTRFWEFGVGGLLGIFGHRLALAAWARQTLALIGAAALVASLVLIDESMPFPGAVALVPVLATAALIAAGTSRADEPQTVIGRLLSTKPMTLIGDLSYSIYLWHWPLILFVPLAAPGLNRVVQMTIAVVLSVGLAMLTYRFVENPVRFSPALSASVKRSALAALGFMLVPVVAAGALAIAYLDVERRNQAILQARDEIPASDGEIPDVVPTPVGDDITIVLVGDSHAAHWQVAFEQAAVDMGATLHVLALNSCTPIPITTVDLEGDVKGSCADFRVQSREFLEEVQPDVIVLSQAEGYLGRIRADDRSEISEQQQLELWQERYEIWLTETAPLATVMGVVIDNPRIPYEPNECLVEASDLTDCDAPRDDALAMTGALQEASAAARAESPVVSATFSVTDELCTADVCRVTIEGLPVYRDFNHLSERWTLTQVPRITEFFEQLVSATR